jgi:CRISPR-associated exonuclease Cas4
VIDTPWLAAVAVLGLLFGLVLVLAGRGMRRYRGLGSGKTVSLDRVTLTSRRLGLTGRPDRLIRQAGTIIVEEWKESARLRPGHRAQMGVYFALVEDQLNLRPSHSFIVCGDGTRHRIDNTAELRTWVVGMAGQIQAAREAVTEPIAVNPSPDQCRACGQVGNCSQARL